MSYRAITDSQEHIKALLREDRFVKISDREDRCDMKLDAWAGLFKNQFLQTWKGVVLQTAITELGIYSMLLHELKPRTVIELGACNGGNALWLADHLKIFGVEGSVYSIDIDLSLLDKKIKDDPRLKFIEGNSNHIEKTLTPELLASLPHPWLVIEDAHVNVSGILNHFHSNGLQAGDYIVIEDTNPLLWEYWVQEKGWNVKDEVDNGPHHLMAEVREWLLKHESEYRIDSHYQDMYGYNVTKNWNGFLKRVSPQ